MSEIALERPVPGHERAEEREDDKRGDGGRA
jgi:hypothetical protein